MFSHLHIALAMVGAVFLSGCAGPIHLHLQEKSAEISAGMTTQEVRQLLGPPQDRQFRESSEVWQYCTTYYEAGFRFGFYLVVWSKSGFVTGMQNYKEQAPIPINCESLIRTVDWEKQPNATIEIRNK